MNSKQIRDEIRRDALEEIKARLITGAVLVVFLLIAATIARAEIDDDSNIFQTSPYRIEAFDNYLDSVGLERTSAPLMSDGPGERNPYQQLREELEEFDDGSEEFAGFIKTWTGTDEDGTPFRAAAYVTQDDDHAGKVWISSTGKTHQPACRYYGKGNGTYEDEPTDNTCAFCSQEAK